MSDEEPQTKRSRMSFATIVSEHILSQEFQDTVRKHWCSQMSIKTANLEIITEPFKVCRISNFFKSEAFLDELKIELSDVHSKRITMDLFHNEQTNDLYDFGGECIEVLHRTFSTDLVTWMENNTNIELNAGLSISSACYYDTDFLLCHDDNMSDRRIAFVLYLVPNWSEEEGGSLDLFDTDVRGLPRNIVRSLYPEYNSLVFFEVSNHSYHQVAEVVTPEMPRWTINGWFHGPIKHVQPPRPEIEHQYFDPIYRNEDLSYWINATYLCSGIVNGINSDVEQQSFTLLGQFVQQEIYTKLSKEIVSESIKWKRVGPANLRNYEVADPTSLTGLLKDFYELFQTIEFCQLLKTYTELDVVPSEKNPKPKMSIELQRWSKGCYTLICDTIDDYDRLVDDGHADDETSIVNSSSGGSEEEKLQQLKINLVKGGEKPAKEEDKPPSDDSTSTNDTMEEDYVRPRFPKAKKKKFEKKKHQESEEASCSKSDDYTTRSPPLNPDSEDSEVSDIGDYLSDSSRCCDDDDQDRQEEEPVEGPGTLDAIIQFHTSNLSEDDIIHYVEPTDVDGSQAHVAPEDNHLALVYYKDTRTCRVHKYINHYVDGYFYNLICTYHQKSER